MTGLISHFIFISPSWDKSEDIEHAGTQVDIGTIRLENVADPVFCGCMIMPKTGERQCMYEKSAVGVEGGGADTGESNGKGGDTLNATNVLKGNAKIGHKGRSKRDTEGDNTGETNAGETNVGDNGKYSSDDIVIANPKDCKV